jgi:tetratricopeptide (TPR) repeat protein
LFTSECNLYFTTFETQFFQMKYLLFILIFLPMSLLAQSSFENGEKCFKSGKYELAKSYFETSLKQNPNDLKTIEYLGDIECHFKEWEAAVPFYRNLTKLKPANAEFFYKYGGAMGMQAKEANKFKALSLLDDVKVAFKKAIQLNPNHVGARWALLEIYIQLPGIVGGSESKAKTYADELLKISPVDGYLSKGHIEEYFRRYSNAEKFYLKAIEIGNSKTTYQKLADLYKNKMAQPEKAKKVWAAYHEKNKS